MNLPINPHSLASRPPDQKLPLERLAAAELSSLQSSLLASLGLRIRHNVHRLGGHSDEIMSMALSPDGQLLATGGFDQTICLWDCAEGRCVRTLSGHRDQICFVAFSPDGRFLASCGIDRRILLWEVMTGKRLSDQMAHEKASLALTFDPNGDRLFSVGRDGFLKAWDVPSLALIWSVQAHKESCRALTRIGQTLYTVSDDGCLSRWDAQDGHPLGTLLDLQKSLCAIQVHPEKSELYVGGDEGLLLAVDPDSGQILRSFRGHEGRIRSLSLDADAGTLFSGADDGTDSVWDLETGSLRHRFGNPGRLVSQARFSADGRFIWFASSCRVACMDVASGSVLHNLHGFTESVSQFALSEASDCIVAIDGNGSPGIWQLSSSRPLKRPAARSSTEDLKSLALSKDGRRCALGDGQGRIRILAIPSGEPLLSFRAHPGAVTSLTFSTDGQTLFSGHRGFKDNLRAWDLQVLMDPQRSPMPDDDDFVLEGIRNHPAYRFGCWGHEDTILGFSLSPDGNLLASGGADKQTLIWDVAKALRDSHLQTTRRLDQPLLRLMNHPDWVQAIQFSPDGTRLLTGCDDGVVRMFGVSNGTLIRTYQGCNRSVVTVDLDRTRVLAGSWDSALRMWDLETGELLQTWERNGKRDSDHYRPLLWDARRALLLCGGNREIRCFQRGTIRPVRVMDTQALSVCALHSIPGENRLFLGCTGRLVTLDMNQGQPRTIHQGSHADYATLAVSTAGEEIAHSPGYGSRPTIFHIFSLIKRRNTLFCQTLSGPSAFAFLPGRRGLLTGCHDGHIYRWDVNNGGIDEVWRGHEGPVRALSVNWIGHQVLSASDDRSVRIWNSNTGKQLAALQGHQKPVHHVIAEGKVAYSGSEDCTVRVWDLEHLTCSRVLETGSPVTALELTADGERLACGLNDGRLIIWNTANFEPELERQLDTCGTSVTGLAWHDRHLVCACAMGTLIFLDQDDYEHLATFQVLEQGFLWTTPADETAPNGWLWTDRPELLNVVECEEDGGHPRALPADDPARIDHLKLYNSERMVVMRLNNPEAYRREVSGLRRLAGASKVLPSLRDSSS